ncbi:hypothetical protein Syun_011764 [Stephania yunnanensis]|uniref:Uncharacterized protein n=1 Tax=Stephania yunnanensis TaxID=152371 RepID=A0AAP0JYW4_9MAGN
MHLTRVNDCSQGLGVYWSDQGFLTRRRQNLERAVIKVKGRLRGFYPMEIMIPGSDGMVAKIFIPKFRVEERGLDSVQMKELLGLLEDRDKRVINEAVEAGPDAWEEVTVALPENSPPAILPTSPWPEFTQQVETSPAAENSA